MSQTISDVMTRDPRTVSSDTSLTDVAREMQDVDAGAVIVTDGDSFKGIVTDRDIVIRAVAEGKDPSSCTAGDICTSDVQTLGPDASVEEAVRVMGEHAVRRIPIVDGDRVVGIVSLGDLAIEADGESALQPISSAPQNN
jgi:CBS domain-containing protein